MNFGNLGIGLILSLIFGWPIALVIFAFVPFMIISGTVQTKMLSGFSAKDKEVLEEAGKVLKTNTKKWIFTQIHKNVSFILTHRSQPKQSETFEQL